MAQHRWLVLVALLLALMVPGRNVAEAQSPVVSRGALLDVPYLAQPVRLCGGAALAMVLRYWGERDVVAQDFASLVDAARGGIPANALANAASKRGWQSFPAALDEATGADRLRLEVNRGRPVVAMIEAGPTVHHFVVVVGVTDTAVVLHDPARAPFQVIPRGEFDAAWSRADRWMLLVLPTPGRTTPARSVTSATLESATTPPSGPCGMLVSRSVADARRGDGATAARGLTAATMLCPREAAGWRELAGLRFAERQYLEAQPLAERAASLAQDDKHAWQLVATTRYLNGDFAGALDAWNHVGEPRTDVVSVKGAARTPHSVIVDLVELPPREVLTSNAFRRAERRLEELPVASDASLRYESTGDGVAAVEATIKERQLTPNDWMEWGTWGAETLLLREVRADLAGRLGAGENLRARYRWAANRPRVRVEFDVPAPGRIPGNVSLDLLWERQAYAALTPGDPPFREERRRIGGHLSDWPAAWLRWQTGAAIDHIDGLRYVAVAAHTTTQWLDDRISVSAGAERWMPTGEGQAFFSGTLTGIGRWTVDRRRPNWIAIVGGAVASPAAPLAVWHGASTSQARGGFLRAHGLTDGGILTSDVLGRRAVFTTFEHHRPVWSSPYGLVTLAMFVDTARAWQRREPAPSLWHTDIGTGVRFGQSGSSGVVRLDLAYGLRDRQIAVSAGYVSAWGQ